MTRMLLIAALLAAPSLARADRYLPAIAVAIAVTKGRVEPKPNPQPNPQPSSKCTNCNGTGKLGDGRVEFDCPECVDGVVTDDQSENMAPVPDDPQQALNQINWVTIEEARASGKPIWLHVYGDYCPPCRELDAQVFPDPRVIAAAQKFACVKLSSQAPMSYRGGVTTVANAMGITRVPRDAFINRDYRPVANPVACPMTVGGYVNHLDQWWSKSQ